MTVTWLSHDHHMTITWLSHDCHMTITWPSHDCHMTITWLSHDCHVTVQIGTHLAQADQHCTSNQELSVNAVRITVLGELKEERLKNGSWGLIQGVNGAAGFVEQDVVVWQQAVAYPEHLATDGSHWGPYVRLLRGCPFTVVVSGERIEGSQLRPSRAKFLRCCTCTESHMNKCLKV